MEKMTNAKALTFVLENATLPADVAEKLSKMLEQVQKKSSAEKKPTATQMANEGFKVAILDGMQENRLYTITDLMKSVPAIADLSNQRVSAIVRQMIGTDIERIEDKRKAYFKRIVKE